MPIGDQVALAMGIATLSLYPLGLVYSISYLLITCLLYFRAIMGMGPLPEIEFLAALFVLWNVFGLANKLSKAGK
jgi:hypothetical protein